MNASKLQTYAALIQHATTQMVDTLVLVKMGLRWRLETVLVSVIFVLFCFQQYANDIP